MNDEVSSATQATSICARCGGFKPLIQNRWRTLCAECQALVAHPIETLPFTAGNLTRTTFKLWLDNARWLVPLAIFGALPLVAVRVSTSNRLWPELACSALVGTLVECISLVYVARRTFSWSGAEAPMALVRRRYVHVLLVNIATGVLTGFGMLCFGVGAFFAANFFQLAVPLALFDGRLSRAAVEESYALSKRHYWKLFWPSALFMSPVILTGFAVGLVGMAGRFIPSLHVASVVLAALGPLLERSATSVAQVFQLAAWTFILRAASDGAPAQQPQ